MPAPDDNEVIAIMNDESLTAIEKIRKKQALINARILDGASSDSEDEKACNFCWLPFIVFVAYLPPSHVLI